jgi:putative DNA primase/helicase
MMARSAKLWPTIADDTPLERAEQIRKADKPTDFRLGVLTKAEFMGISIPEPKFILSGLVMEKSITIVNGARGCGKSWLIESIANEVAWGGRVGPWECEKAMNVLLVDGEMSMSLLQERIRMMDLGRDVRRQPRSLYLYPESYSYRLGLKRASILDSVWRCFILDLIGELDVGLLVLDNLSALAPGIDENEKMEFDPVNRWLLELRFHDVATIMAHHLGKSGDQRGTTAHEDHVDLAIQLHNPNRRGGCKFLCTPTKDRAYITGDRKWRMELVEGKGGRKEFKWSEISEGKEEGTSLNVEGFTCDEAMHRFGISRRTYFRAKRK